MVGYDAKALQGGFTAAGASFANVSDGSIKLGDLKVTGYGDEGYADNMIVAQTLTTNGKADAKYYWVDYSEGGETWYGWYNTEWDIDHNTESLAADAGLWVQAPEGSVLTITFPSPIK